MRSLSGYSGLLGYEDLSMGERFATTQRLGPQVSPERKLCSDACKKHMWSYSKYYITWYMEIECFGSPHLQRPSCCFALQSSVALTQWRNFFKICYRIKLQGIASIDADISLTSDFRKAGILVTFGRNSVCNRNRACIFLFGIECLYVLLLISWAGCIDRFFIGP